jgi:hypothetical protein
VRVPELSLRFHRRETADLLAHLVDYVSGK